MSGNCYTYTQPIPKINASATFDLMFICKGQTNAIGRIPMVKSHSAATTLYRYATFTVMCVSMQLPLDSILVQKCDTGLHCKARTKKNTSPTTTVKAITAYSIQL
jgi:hypothetical protein